MRCSNCGLDGGESTGHRCLALLTSCRLCGSIDGASTGHICPALQPQTAGTIGSDIPRIIAIVFLPHRLL